MKRSVRVTVDQRFLDPASATPEPRHPPVVLANLLVAPLEPSDERHRTL